MVDIHLLSPFAFPEYTKVQAWKFWAQQANIRATENSIKKKMHHITTCIGLGSSQRRWHMPHTWYHQDWEPQWKYWSRICKTNSRWDSRAGVLCLCWYGQRRKACVHVGNLDKFWDSTIVLLESWIIMFDAQWWMEPSSLSST